MERKLKSIQSLPHVDCIGHQVSSHCMGCFDSTPLGLEKHIIISLINDGQVSYYSAGVLGAAVL